MEPPYMTIQCLAWLVRCYQDYCHIGISELQLGGVAATRAFLCWQLRTSQKTQRKQEMSVSNNRGILQWMVYEGKSD